MLPRDEDLQISGRGCSPPIEEHAEAVEVTSGHVIQGERNETAIDQKEEFTSPMRRQCEMVCRYAMVGRQRKLDLNYNNIQNQKVPGYFHLI